MRRSSALSKVLELKAIVPGHSDVSGLQHLLADGAIRLVVIATPNPSHFELARRCLQAGRNVVVDKPFTITSQEAEELAAIAASRNVLLTGSSEPPLGW